MRAADYLVGFISINIFLGAFIKPIASTLRLPAGAEYCYALISYSS